MAAKLKAKQSRFAAWYTGMAIFRPEDAGGDVFHALTDGRSTSDLCVLGFDPSLTGPGAAVFVGGSHVMQTSMPMKGTNLSARERARRIYEWSKELFEQYRPDVVAFEDVNSGRNFTGMRDTATARGAIMAAVPEGAVFFTVSVTSLKSMMGIKTRGVKREEAKAAAISFIEDELGVYVGDNDDEADALSVGLFTLRLLEVAEKLSRSCDEYDDDIVREVVKKYEKREGYGASTRFLLGLKLLQEHHVGTYKKAVYRAKKVS